MRFARRHREGRLAEISIVPLIDLFLNILVFFMVTTTFGSDSVFFVDLPEASPGQGMGEKKMVTVAISAKGEIALDNKAITRDQFREELQKIAPERRKIFPVVIRADRDARHGAVISVIDVVRQAGFENVGMATKIQTMK